MTFLTILMVSLISLFTPFAALQNTDISAEAIQKQTTSVFASTISNDDDEISLALFTKLGLDLCSGTNSVSVVLTNEFTLFPSTIKVSLSLYSSLTKTTDISQMTFEGSTSSDDLNMNTSISVTASTHGEDRYWVGYAIYYKGSKQTTYQTDIQFYYADGTYNPAY